MIWGRRVAAIWIDKGVDDPDAILATVFTAGNPNLRARQRTLSVGAARLITRVSPFLLSGEDSTVRAGERFSLGVGWNVGHGSKSAKSDLNGGHCGCANDDNNFRYQQSYMIFICFAHRQVAFPVWKGDDVLRRLPDALGERVEVNKPPCAYNTKPNGEDNPNTRPLAAREIRRPKRKRAQTSIAEVLLKELPVEPSEAAMRALVMSDHAHVRERFFEEFSAEINEIVAALTAAYSAYRRLEDKVQLDHRSAYVQAFAFTALNSLITSTNLLLSGLQLPSGNLMRQYGEASAMALLCSHPSIDVLTRVRKDPHSFPYQNAIEIVSRKRNRQLLGLKGPEWKTFGEIAKFYDRFSHASFFAVASQTMFNQPGMLIVLGEFDPEKIEPYRIEMRRRKTAATVLCHLMDYLSDRLPQKKDSDADQS